jgi:hypothetical protein
VPGSVPTFVRRPRRAARAAALTFIAFAGLAGAASPARAGDYLAYVCHAPDESAFSLDAAWTGKSYLAFSAPIDVCGRGSNGYFGLNMGSAGAPPAYGVGAATSLTWTAPAHVQAQSVYVRRSVFSGVSSSDVNASPVYSLTAYGPQSAQRLDSCDSNASHSCVLGQVTPDPPSNGVTFGPIGATSIVMLLECAGSAGGSCSTSGGGARMYTAFSRITLTLRDEAAPTAGSLGGTALDAGGLSGKVDVTFNAFDEGAGVYQSILLVDGTEVRRSTPSDPMGSCSDAVAGNATEYEFKATKPCPDSAFVDVPVDTTKLSNGAHQLKVLLRDASGNTKTVVDRAVTVANTAAVVPGLGGAGGSDTGGGVVTGLPNGTGGSLATGTFVAVPKERTIAAQFGGKLTIKRRLVDAAKQPIAGAAVDVYERIDRAGAAWTKVATVTSDAKGDVRYVPSTGASRTIRFAYAASTGSTQYGATIEVQVDVAAHLTIAAAKRSVPRNGTIKFSGTVGLDGTPPHTRVELQYKSHGDWRTFATAPVDTKGQWVYTRHLTAAHNVTIAFRSLLRPAVGLASSRSVSAAIKVRVR